MNKTPFPLLLPLLVALSATAHDETSEAPPSAPGIGSQVAQQSSLSTQAEDVWQAFNLFPSSYLLEKLVESGDEVLFARVKKDIEAIRPCCEMLHTLPPERVKELILLADAVLWQSQWLSNIYLGEFGIECEAPFDVGLWDLSHSAKLIKQVLSGTKATSPEVKALLHELVEMVGGEQVLDYPAAWYDEQLAEDYKTALQFYKDFCAAVSTEDESHAIDLLREQKEVLAYFAAKGEGEIWRVNKLAGFFHATLTSLREQGMSPYPEPLLPQRHRTPARMRALHPFLQALPLLRELLFS